MLESGKEDPIERLVQTLETMMVARDKMYEEKNYENYRQVWKIKEEVYNPARDELKKLLTDLLKDKIEA